MTPRPPSVLTLAGNLFAVGCLAAASAVVRQLFARDIPGVAFSAGVIIALVAVIARFFVTARRAQANEPDALLAARIGLTIRWATTFACFVGGVITAVVLMNAPGGPYGTFALLAAFGGFAGAVWSLIRVLNATDDVDRRFERTIGAPFVARSFSGMTRAVPAPTEGMARREAELLGPQASPLHTTGEWMAYHSAGVVRVRARARRIDTSARDSAARKVGTGRTDTEHVALILDAAFTTVQTCARVTLRQRGARDVDPQMPPALASFMVTESEPGDEAARTLALLGRALAHVPDEARATIRGVVIEPSGVAFQLPQPQGGSDLMKMPMSGTELTAALWPIPMLRAVLDAVANR